MTQAKEDRHDSLERWCTIPIPLEELDISNKALVLWTNLFGCPKEHLKQLTKKGEMWTGQMKSNKIFCLSYFYLGDDSLFKQRH